MEDKKFEPVFVGKGEELSEEIGMSIDLCISDIPEYAIRKDTDGRKWVTLTLRKLKEPRKRQTHSLRVFFPKKA